MQDSFTGACESSAYNLLSSGEYKTLSVGWVAVIRHLQGYLVIHFSEVVEIKW